MTTELTPEEVLNALEYVQVKVPDLRSRISDAVIRGKIPESEFAERQQRFEKVSSEIIVALMDYPPVASSGISGSTASQYREAIIRLIRQF